MVLIIDPQTSGVAGNMFIGAFIDLGADQNKIRNIINSYASEFGEIKIDITKELRSGVETTYANIQAKDNTTRHYSDIVDELDRITKEKYPHDELIKKTISLSKKIFKTIAIAESEVHGKTLETIHFHEVGLADAIADVIGASYGYYLLKLDEDKIYSLPVATGCGTVKTQHGLLPVPAPAVANILKNVPTHGGTVQTELATPTGSAILVNITDEYCQYHPTIINKKIGYGAGSKDTKTLNALRLIKAEKYMDNDSITVLETNLDTLTGEVLGNLYNKLLNEGARDVSLTPTIMKKNRPGHILKVITPNHNREHLIKVIMEETGTLGIRILPCAHRAVAKRENVPFTMKINNENETIQFKIGYIEDKIIKCSPEYEDIKRISDKTDIPLRDLMKLAEQEYKKYLREGK